MKLVNYYEDPTKPFVNALPDRAWFMPFENEEKARTCLREESGRMQLLNGSWKFAWYPSIDATPGNFMLPDYDPCELGNIDVPGCWQTQGYDKYHYDGCHHDSQNNLPYRRFFAAHLYDLSDCADRCDRVSFVSAQGV